MIIINDYSTTKMTLSTCAGVHVHVSNTSWGGGGQKVYEHLIIQEREREKGTREREK